MTRRSSGSGWLPVFSSGSTFDTAFSLEAAARMIARAHRSGETWTCRRGCRPGRDLNENEARELIVAVKKELTHE